MFFYGVSFVIRLIFVGQRTKKEQKPPHISLICGPATGLMRNLRVLVELFLSNKGSCDSIYAKI